MPISVQGLRVRPDWRRQWQAGERSPYPIASPHDIAWRFSREIDRRNPDGTVEDDSIDTGLISEARTPEYRPPRDGGEGLLEKTLEHRLHRPSTDEPPLRTLEYRPSPRDGSEPLMQLVQEGASVSKNPATLPHFDVAESPTVNDRNERRRAILVGTPARFQISDEMPPPEGESWVGQAWDWVERRAVPHHDTARKKIGQYNKVIEDEAAAQNIDPDLVRALMYAEIARGIVKDDFKEHIAEPLIDRGLVPKVLLGKVLSRRESYMPMNFNPRLWGDIVDNADVTEDARMNIRAGIRLAREIQDRVDTPTPAKIGSLYNFMGAERINEHGERVQKAYDQKLWLKERASVLHHDLMR